VLKSDYYGKLHQFNDYGSESSKILSVDGKTKEIDGIGVNNTTTVEAKHCAEEKHIKMRRLRRSTFYLLPKKAKRTF
jgi:hypothetical protein